MYEWIDKDAQRMQLDINRFTQRERQIDGWVDRWIQVKREAARQTAMKVYPKVPPVVTWTEQEVVQISATYARYCCYLLSQFGSEFLNHNPI